MLLGGLELHRGHLVAAKLGQELRPFLPDGRFGKRAAQARGRCSRRPAACRGGRCRPECLNPAAIVGCARQQQVRGDPLWRSSVPRQFLGHGSMASIALAGRKLLVQGGAHDRMDKPQALGASEDVGANEVVRGLTGDVRAQTGDAGAET